MFSETPRPVAAPRRTSPVPDIGCGSAGQGALAETHRTSLQTCALSPYPPSMRNASAVVSGLG